MYSFIHADASGLIVMVLFMSGLLEALFGVGMGTHGSFFFMWSLSVRYQNRRR